MKTSVEILCSEVFYYEITDYFDDFGYSYVGIYENYLKKIRTTLLLVFSKRN